MDISKLLQKKDKFNLSLVDYKKAYNMVPDSWIITTRWPTKMSLFFFGKNKETFNIFSPRIVEVYIILLVETTLELIMFYYTFSVISNMFVPCTVLMYDSTAATQTSELSTTLLSISCGTHLISLLMLPSHVWGFFHKLGLWGTPSENSPVGWDLGNRMSRGCRFDVKWVCPMGIKHLGYIWNKILCSFLGLDKWREERTWRLG